MERHLPLGIGALSTVTASIVDINWGALAGGITVLGTALGAAYWQLANRRLAVMRAEAAARLEDFRNEQLARIEIQRRQDEVNKDSLTAKLAAISGQMTNLQRSADDAREVNDALRGRLEDANRKLHDLLNEENARTLRHEAEKLELQHKYDDLLHKLDDAHAENLHLVARIGEDVKDTQAQADRNSARIDAISPAPAPEAP